MSILLFIINLNLFFIIYYIITSLSSVKINKLNRGFINFFNKTNYFNYLNESLSYIKKFNILNISLINPLSIFIISLVIAIITFFLIFNNLQLLISSIIVSIMVFLFPIFILELLKRLIRYKIKNSFSLYIIGIQSFSKNSNDVIMALNKVKVIKPLNIHIDDFNILVNNGFDIFKAFNNIINEIKIKEVSKLFHLLKLCYINGGNLNRVINQYNEYFIKTNDMKNKQNEKRNYYFLILGIIIFINIFLVFLVILKNTEYKEIIFSSYFGKILIDINVSLYFIIVLTIMKIVKGED